MPLTLPIAVHFVGEQQVYNLLNQVLTSIGTIMSALDTLKTEVAQNTEVIASAVTLINGLKAKLDAAIASGDPAQLEALSASLDSSSNALAAAVATNTPADPAPVVAPDPIAP